MKIAIPAESVLRQMPGIIAVKEVRDKSYFLFTNETVAKMMGYSDPDDVVGLSDCDAKCDDIVNNCEIFYQHDREVMTGKTLRTLDVYPYPTEYCGILAIKKPLYDADNNIVAVIAQGFPLRQEDLSNIISNIPDFYNLSKKTQTSINTTFQITEKIDFFNLTQKELECFFYLLRGKSAPEIAAILCRSIKTIETHIQNIKDKCKLNKKSELFDLAYAYGLLNILPPSLIPKTNNFTQILS